MLTKLFFLPQYGIARTHLLMMILLAGGSTIVMGKRLNKAKGFAVRVPSLISL